ncbi:putative membrane protein YccC [Luteibacter sp. 1214]|uniref:FUSC family protein n=1 Tax=Luteibacter sp. 1214 TaxID=2817735 RepID=UPI00285592F2|nr:FUSC family protein [Luteibacter sp. 1214]MDR6642150.1 putative membrane protein YccC [Luteibacter sp. 1214]
MSATGLQNATPGTRQIVVETLREEVNVWLFVVKTLIAFFLTGWLAMRLDLPAPSTAMLTTVIVANRQSGMVLAKSFYRAIGTLAGATAAIAIVAAFPQERDLFLLALSLWIGVCAGGATLYRNFKSYAFVLGGYTAAIVAIPVIDNPPGVFDSSWARISEVLLGLMVSGLVNDIVFPSRMRDVLRRAAREQFASFVGFVRDSTGGSIARDTMEKAHLRFVRAAVTLEDLRSSVIFEDAEARARSNHLRLFNQRFMAASTSFQSLHHLINRLKRAQRDLAADTLIRLYAPIGEALDAPIEAGAAARVLLPRLVSARDTMRASVPGLRASLSDSQDVRDFDTGASLLTRFVDELHGYVDAAASLQTPRVIAGSAERVRFDRGNDFLGAGLATFRTTLTMLVLGAFWIYSAWPLGSSAMLLATVFAGLFATIPNPTRVTWQVMLGYLSGMAVGFICEFLLLTQVDGYGLLVVCVAPFLALGLVMMMAQRLAFYGLGWAMGFAYILSLKNVQVYDPAHFINDAIAQVVGLGAAAVSFVVIPPAIGSAWLRRRQLARLRGQVALAAEAPLPGLRHRFESVNYDLVSQVVAQTQPGSADSRSLIAWALAVHETGRALIELRHDLARGDVPPTLRPYLDDALRTLARFYEKPDAAGYLLARDAVATAIASVGEHEGVAHLLEHLHLVRMALLDGESVLAAYMPTAPLSKDIAHAS